MDFAGGRFQVFWHLTGNRDDGQNHRLVRIEYAVSLRVDGDDFRILARRERKRTATRRKRRGPALRVVRHECG